MLLGHGLQTEQRGLGNGGHCCAHPSALDVTFVAVDLDGGPAVTQSGTDTDHQRRRTPSSAAAFWISSRDAVR